MSDAAMPVRVAMWSGPRNISTAMMRAWENRGDCAVSDEPLYAHYLDRTGLDHPVREEVIADGDTDWQRVVATLLGPAPGDATVWYQKHMTHHLLPHMDHAWIAQLRNVLLIRDPREVVASYVKSRATVTADDIGLPQQVALYDELCAAGSRPPIMDGHRLHPTHAAVAERSARERRHLGTALVCARVGIHRLRSAGGKGDQPVRCGG
jgi:Sulfotransferase domain